MRKLPALLLVAAILLSGCSKKITYTLSFNIENGDQRSMLALASMRVIERRLSRMGNQLLEQDVNTKNGITKITVSIRDRAAAQTLTEELVTPFSLRIMQSKGKEPPDTTVEGHGNFWNTDINEKHLEWVEARPEGTDNEKKGTVILYFTPEGRELMKKVFRDNKGKAIGIFIREQLVSKLTVESEKIRDQIVIQNIPSVEIAKIFADDVNVGLHVTFSPDS